MARSIVFSSLLFGVLCAFATSMGACGEDTAASPGKEKEGAPTAGGSGGTSGNEADTSTLTIRQIVEGRPELRSLQLALSKDLENDATLSPPETTGSVAEVLGDESGQYEYTLFAPTDTAFAKLKQTCTDELLNASETSGQERLRGILQYHGLLERFQPSEIYPSGYSTFYEPASSLNPLRITITKTGEEIEIDERAKAKIVSTYQAKNGVVYTIDTVLIPPSPPAPPLPATCL